MFVSLAASAQEGSAEVLGVMNTSLADLGKPPWLMPVEGSECQRACVGSEVMETAAELQIDSLL